MDSLLVSYASSDEDDDAACPRPSRPPKLPSFSNSIPPQASSSFLPSPPPLATSSSSSSPSSFLVSSLPPPKSQLPNHFLDDDNDSKDDEGKPSRPPLSSMFSFLPPAKTSMSYTLSSIPVADSQPGNQSSKLSSDQNPSKRIVRLTLPLNPSMLKSQDSDSDDNEDEKRRKARKNVSSSSSITSVLPAPKNSLCVAPAQSSGVSRRSTLQAITTSQSPSLDLKAVEEEVSIANGTNYSAEKGVASGYYDTSSYAAEQVASGYENYTNDLGNVVVDPGAMSNPAITCWEQVNGDGVGYGGYMDNCSIVSQGERRSVVPDIGRFTGKRGRANIPTEIVEVKQDELMKNRPREDQVKLTGIAFGPAYQPSPSAKGKPTKLHKRKHQIGSLYYDLKQKEMELSERRSKGLLTKAETQAKYGW